MRTSEIKFCSVYLQLFSIDIR